MDEKYLMEQLLFADKVINDLYMHGCIESSNESVFLVFSKGLQDAMKMHNELYNEMSNAGFYNLKNVESSKIKQTLEKLQCTCSECEGK